MNNSGLTVENAFKFIVDAQNILKDIHSYYYCNCRSWPSKSQTLKKNALCPVHMPGQNVFCLGQNQICPRKNDFVQDNTFFCPRQKFCPQLKNHFCFGETHFKPWTKFLTWTKNILS